MRKANHDDWCVRLDYLTPAERLAVVFGPRCRDVPTQRALDLGWKIIIGMKRLATAMSPSLVHIRDGNKGE